MKQEHKLYIGVAILVAPLSNKYAVAPVSMLSTAGTMVLASLILGWETSGELRPRDHGGWLAASSHQVQELVTEKESTNGLPLLLGSLVAIAGIVLSFVVFW